MLRPHPTASGPGPVGWPGLPRGRALGPPVGGMSTSPAGGGGSGGGPSAAQPLNLPEPPVLRPTAEEFADPLKYLASVRAAVEPYGMCLVVPPEGWAPPLALDLDALRFPTSIQSVCELQHRTQAKEQHEFYEAYDAFLQSQGKSLAKFKVPLLNNRDIDIYRLHRAVRRRGGYTAVHEEKRWRDVARVLQVRPAVQRRGFLVGVGACARGAASRGVGGDDAR